jgi:hypothetical protein
MVIHAGWPLSRFSADWKSEWCEFIASGDQFHDWPGQSAKGRLLDEFTDNCLSIYEKWGGGF